MGVTGVARAVGAVAALAFAATVALAPDADRQPRPSQLAVGDAYAGGRIVELRWTSDHSRLLAVTQRGRNLSMLAVEPDGTRRIVAGPVIGDLDLYPAPTGSQIAFVRTRRNLRARVAVMDVAGRHEAWSRWTQGPTTVRWAPGLDTLAIADADACSVVSALDGQLVDGKRCGV